jgi:hypothetical protein
LVDGGCRTARENALVFKKKPISPACGKKKSSLKNSQGKATEAENIGTDNDWITSTEGS